MWQVLPGFPVLLFQHAWRRCSRRTNVQAVSLYGSWDHDKSKSSTLRLCLSQMFLTRTTAPCWVLITLYVVLHLFMPCTTVMFSSEHYI